MSISVRKLFDSSQLTDSFAPVFTLSESTKTIIDNLVVRVVNTAATAVDVEAHLVKSGASAIASNKVAAISVGAGEVFLLAVPVMANTDALHMKASTAAVVTIHHQSGLPKTP